MSAQWLDAPVTELSNQMLHMDVRRIDTVKP